MGRMADMNGTSKEELGVIISEKWGFLLLKLGEHQKCLMNSSNMQISVLPSWGFGFIMFVALESPFLTCQVRVMQGGPRSTRWETPDLQFPGNGFSQALRLPENWQISHFLYPFLPPCPWRGLCFQMGSVHFSCFQAFPQGLQLCKPLAVLSWGLVG